MIVISIPRSNDKETPGIQQSGTPVPGAARRLLRLWAKINCQSNVKDVQGRNGGANSLNTHSIFCRINGTQVGKSTLLNALLGHQVLAVSASAACTAVATEISYKNIQSIEAFVEFISLEEWRARLAHLIEDVVDTAVDTQEGPADNSSISPACRARDNLFGVYPQLKDVDPKHWVVEELLTDPLVNQHLGRTECLKASRARDLQKEVGASLRCTVALIDSLQLEQFLSSAITNPSPSTRALWPLVKIVKIAGQFDVLSTGVTLVDLPGNGDADIARDGVANEYLKTADAVCLVANIMRAKDDRDLHLYLHKHLAQMILDGRIQDNSLLLLLTGADNTIGSNEILLDSGKQATVDSLQQVARSLATEIQGLQTRKERQKHSRAKKVGERLERQIIAKRVEKEKKIKEKNRLLAFQRSEVVEEHLKQKIIELFQEISQSETRVHIPIFCLGSRDFINMDAVETDTPTIFVKREETGIPRLRRHFLRDAEQRNLSDAATVVTEWCGLLYRAIQPLAGSAASTDTALEIHRRINVFENTCTTMVDELTRKIGKEYDALLIQVEKAVSEAERNSPAVFESHTAMRWNTYCAMMRQEGRYDNGNLNADLTKTILPAIQQKWYNAVNVRIPLYCRDFLGDLRDEFNLTLDLISTASPQHNLNQIRKSIALESVLKDLDVVNIEFTRSAQRSGTRAWTPLIREHLVAQYARASAEKGPGMYNRMKRLPVFRSAANNLQMNKNFIESDASQIFSPLNDSVRELFDSATAHVGMSDGVILKQLLELMRQTLLGEFPLLSRYYSDPWNPYKSARIKAAKMMNRFVREHENASSDLLDNLKTRLQQLSRPLA
ncbi:hypothetical protein C8R47DRAFT_1204505 [Mycena vitilis]|nr:hypothetical protein C8R47DRAFT_1204505 [Mycena vitilis]